MISHSKLKFLTRLGTAIDAQLKCLEKTKTSHKYPVTSSKIEYLSATEYQYLGKLEGNRGRPTGNMNGIALPVHRLLRETQIGRPHIPRNPIASFFTGEDRLFRGQE